MTHKKVIILVPCLLVGGTEMHTLMLARALTNAGYHVTVCAYYEHDTTIVNALKKAGVNVTLLNLTRAPGRNLASMPRLVTALASVMRRLKPHYAHIQYMTPAIAPILVARALRVPRVIATVHVPAQVYGRRAWVPSKIMSRLTHTFLTVSQPAQQSYFQTSSLFDEQALRLGQKHFTINNPVDIDHIDHIKQQTNTDTLRAALQLTNAPVIAMLARMSLEKDPANLISAMAQINESHPTAQLLMLGDGKLKPQLVAQAKQLGIDHRVTWTGQLKPDHAIAHLAIADIVAVPSRFEGFGLVAAEAMALAKPVVASAVGGLTSVVKHNRTGILVPPNQPTQLAQAITTLLDHPDKRHAMGLAGRTRAQNKFAFNIFAESHLRLYRALDTPQAKNTPSHNRPGIQNNISTESRGGYL